jgi:hypothetical protein
VACTCGYGEELSVSINAGNFLTSCKVYWLASQEGLCSMEYVGKGFMFCRLANSYRLFEVTQFLQMYVGVFLLRLTA